jgi:hypothetical protein
MDISISKKVNFFARLGSTNFFLLPALIIHDTGPIRSVELRFLLMSIGLEYLTYEPPLIRFGASWQFKWRKLELDIVWLDYDLHLLPTFITSKVSNGYTTDFRFLYLMITLYYEK